MAEKKQKVVCFASLLPLNLSLVQCVPYIMAVSFSNSSNMELFVLKIVKFLFYNNDAIESELCIFVKRIK
jgi:hypothetical protein